MSFSGFPPRTLLSDSASRSPHVLWTPPSPRGHSVSSRCPSMPHFGCAGLSGPGVCHEIAPDGRSADFATNAGRWGHFGPSCGLSPLTVVTKSLPLSGPSPLPIPLSDSIFRPFPSKDSSGTLALAPRMARRSGSSASPPLPPPALSPLPPSAPAPLFSFLSPLSPFLPLPL